MPGLGKNGNKTPEALETLIRKSKVAGIVKFFEAMTEAERREFAPRIVALVPGFHEFGWLSERSYGAKTDTSVRGAATLAALASASLTELRKLGWQCTPPMWSVKEQEPYLTLMRERAPDWIDRWAEWLLEDNFRHWRFVRRMVREGLCQPPESDFYVLGMIEGLRPVREEGNLIDAILADRELLDGLFWRLFEVEGGGELSLAACDKYTADESGWSYALRELAARCEIDRNRLLDVSLDALNRDFSQFRAGWFSRFHEFLEPTPEERAARAGRYLDLLASPIPPTVSFAMKALTALHKVKKLDGAAFVGRVEAVLHAKAKGTVKQALRMMTAFAKADADLASRVCTIATAALEHPESEVQESALALIETFGDPADDELLPAIEERRDIIAAPLRARITGWLGCDAQSGDAPDNGEDLTALIARARALPPDLAEAAGVDLALQALDSQEREIGTAAYNGLNVPRISGDMRVAPADTPDALIELFLRALADPFDVERVELAIGGVCRLCDQRPNDFAARTKPLAKRVTTLLENFGGHHSTAWTSPAGTLALLAHAWLEGRDPAALCRASIKHRFHVEQAGAAGIFVHRALELARFVAARKAVRSLSAPTHRGGWIAPQTLVERVRAWREAGHAVAAPDLILALLRLAPDDRAAALKAARDLDGEAGAALRHALGGAGESIGKTVPIWIAAARARAPLEDDESVEAKFPGLGPDAGRAAKLDFEIHTRTWRTPNSDKEESWDYLAVLYAPAPEKPPPSQAVAWKHALTGFARKWEKYRLLPTVLAHINPIEPTGGAPGQMEQQCLNSPWAALLWPANPKPLYAATALNAAGWEHSQRPAAEPPLAGYRVALDSDAMIGRPGRMMLCMGLNALDSAERQLTTDLLIASIRDGRLNTVLLPLDMWRLVKSGLIKPKRWAARLREAAGESALLAQAVRQALEGALALGDAKPPRDLHALMELLHELCVESGEAVTHPGARDYLAAIKGGGKAAKLAKTLLAMEEAEPLPHRRAAAALGLAGRVERAERWAGRRKEARP
jgi:hypothetical protein